MRKYKKERNKLDNDLQKEGLSPQEKENKQQQLKAIHEKIEKLIQ